MFNKLKSNVLGGLARQLKAGPSPAQGHKSQQKKTAGSKGLSCGVEFKTSGSVVKVEEWLEANAVGKYTIGLGGIDDQSQEKTLIIMFQLESDKTSFLAKHSGQEYWTGKTNV